MYIKGQPGRIVALVVVIPFLWFVGVQIKLGFPTWSPGACANALFGLCVVFAAYELAWVCGFFRHADE